MSERYYLYELMFPNGKRYIGITNDFARRWREHRKESARGGNFRVNAAIRKYGHESIQRRILVIGRYDYIRDLEIRAIEALRTSNKKYGHNISLGGDLTSPETRLKLSAAQRCRWRNMPAEKRAQIAKAIGDRPRSAEERAKLSASLKGKKKSPEHIAKIVAMNLRRGPPSKETREKQRIAWTPELRTKQAARRLGRKASPETKVKQIAALRARRHSVETIAKMRDAWTPERRIAWAASHRGRKLTPEHIAKVANANRGKRRSPEACARIREGCAAREKRRVEKANKN